MDDRDAWLTWAPHGKKTILPKFTEFFTAFLVATLLETTLRFAFALVDGTSR